MHITLKNAELLKHSKLDKNEGRTDQRNAQINFSLFKLLRHVTSQHSTVSTSPHEYSTQQHPSILTDCNGL